MHLEKKNCFSCFLAVCHLSDFVHTFVDSLVSYIGSRFRPLTHTINWLRTVLIPDGVAADDAPLAMLERREDRGLPRSLPRGLPRALSSNMIQADHNDKVKECQRSVIRFQVDS